MIYNYNLAYTVSFDSGNKTLQILVSLGKIDKTVFQSYYTLGSYSTKIYSDNYQEGLRLAYKVQDELTYWIDPGRTDIIIPDRNIMTYCRKFRNDGEYKDPQFKDVPGYINSIKVTLRHYIYHFGHINKQDEYIVLEDIANNRYKAFRSSLVGTVILINGVDDVVNILCKETIVDVFNRLKELETSAKVSDFTLSDKIIPVESQIQAISPTKFTAKTRYLVNWTEKVKFNIDYVILWDKGNTRSYCVINEKETLVLPISELIRYQLFSLPELSIRAIDLIPV